MAFLDQHFVSLIKKFHMVFTIVKHCRETNDFLGPHHDDIGERALTLDPEDLGSCIFSNILLVWPWSSCFTCLDLSFFICK